VRGIVCCLVLSSLARAEDPAVQFAPLRIERGREANALGWKVTEVLLGNGMQGRVCRVRFRLSQDGKSWEETRQRNVPLEEWSESAFYKYSFLAEKFDSARDVQVSFTLIDLVGQRELGSVMGTLTGDAKPLLTVGDLDLAPTWERSRRGEKHSTEDGSVFADRWHKLPRREKGYWRQWVPNGGARNARLIVGGGGELWFFDGKSFLQIR
jgi:hypothetical protein